VVLFAIFKAKVEVQDSLLDRRVKQVFVEGGHQWEGRWTQGKGE
jgi:hypothetical protein